MRFLSLAAGVLCAVAATTAQAGHLGSAFIDVSGLTVIDTSSNLAVTADFNTPGSGTAQINARSSSTDGRNETSLTGFPTVINTGSTTILNLNPALGPGGTIIAPAPEPLSAYSGSGAAPAENAFGVLTSLESVRSDSTYSGSFANLASDANPIVAGIATGANATTIADFNVVTAQLVGKGGAFVSNTSSLDFVATADITARIDWTETVILTLSDFAPPGPAYATTALVTFSISVTEAGSGAQVATVSRSFGITGPNAAFAPGAVNLSTANFGLLSGNRYTLDVQQAAIVTLNPVPEPTSMAIFGLMGVGAVVGGRRRRRKNA